MTLLIAALPTVLQLVSFILGKVNASNETLAAFQALVEAAHNDNLLSKDSKDVFAKQKAELDKQV